MTFRAVLFCVFALRSSEAAVSTWQAFAALEAISEVAGRQMLWARSGLVVSCAPSARGQTLNIADRRFMKNDPMLGNILRHVAIVRLRQREFASARKLCERALVIPETAFGAQMPCVIAPLQTYAGIVRSARGKRTAKRINALFKMLLRAENSKS